MWTYILSIDMNLILPDGTMSDWLLMLATILHDNSHKDLRKFLLRNYDDVIWASIIIWKQTANFCYFRSPKLFTWQRCFTFSIRFVVEITFSIAFRFEVIQSGFSSSTMQKIIECRHSHQNPSFNQKSLASVKSCIKFAAYPFECIAM